MIRRSVFIGVLVSTLGCGGSSNPVNPITDAGGGSPDVGMAVEDTGPTADVTGMDGTVPTDGGATCGGSLGPCNPVTNTGCAAGMGCYVVASSASDAGTTLQAMCLAAGTHGAGAACMSTNDCLEGFGCLGSPGVCTKLCCGNDNTSCRDETHGGQLGALCAGTVTGTDFKFCIASMTCNPYLTTGNGCPTAMPLCTVIAVDGTTNCNPQNASAGGAGHGCCGLSDCLPGYLCIGSASATCNPAMPNATCRRVCDPTAVGDAGAGQCPAGLTCGMVNNSPSNYGVCVPTMMPADGGM